MAYEDLVELLGSSGSINMTTLPDGSIDIYYEVVDRYGKEIKTRKEFAERLLDSRYESFSIREIDKDTGGQAVNMAKQAHALEDDVTLLGHVDDPLFDSLGFDTVSMGPPTEVFVYEFVKSEIMLAEYSEHMDQWGFSDLSDAVEGAFKAFFGVDAVLCANWISFGRMTDVLRELASLEIDGNLFVLDTGDVTAKKERDLVQLFEALEELENSYDVVVSENRNEIEYSAESLGVEASSDEGLVEGIREESDITGVVLHDRPKAVASTPNGTIEVENIEVKNPRRRTGGGDRFGAGLGHGLASGWGWEKALALGNLCASYYVENATTGGINDLINYSKNN